MHLFLLLSALTNLRAGDESRPHEDGDLGQTKVPVETEVEQRVHEIHLLRGGGRGKERHGAPSTWTFLRQ